MINAIKLAVTVNAPVEVVWENFMNPEHLSKWLTGFVSIEHFEGNIGKEESTSRLILLERGKQFEVIEKVLLCKPFQQYTFIMQHAAMDSLSDVRFVSIGQITEVVQAVQFSPKGIRMKIMMPFMKGVMKKRMAKDLRNLKEWTESR